MILNSFDASDISDKICVVVAVWTGSPAMIETFYSTYSHVIDLDLDLGLKVNILTLV